MCGLPALSAGSIHRGRLRSAGARPRAASPPPQARQARRRLRVGPSPPFDGGYGGAMGGSGGSGGRFQLDRSQSMHAENWQGQDAYGNDPDYEGGKYERGARGFGMDVDGGVGESKFDGGFDGSGPFGGSGGSGGGCGGSGGPFGGAAARREREYNRTGR